VIIFGLEGDLFSMILWPQVCGTCCGWWLKVWVMNGVEKSKCLLKTCFSATLSRTTLTWIGLIWILASAVRIQHLMSMT